MAGKKKKGVVAHPPTKKGGLPPIPPGLARVHFRVVLAPRMPPAADVPVAGATVEITGQFKGTTDAKGEVLTHSFPPGTFQLLISKPGHGPVPKFDTDPFVADVNVVDPAFQVVAGENVVVRELSDGTGALIVKVQKPDNTQVNDCDVTVVGTAVVNTQTAGQSEFRRVPAGKRDVRARKVGFGPNKTPFAFGEATPDAEVVIAAGFKKESRIVLTSEPSTTVRKIKAKLPATKTLRSPAISPALADNTLTESASDAEDLAANAPVILVRGCTQVELEVETLLSGKPVDWAVKPNQNTESAPTITPKDGGKKADLSTNKTGSFSVIAAVGDSRKIWNVVFVFVDVKVATSVIVGRATGYADSGSTATSTGYKSGNFIFGQQAMEATVDVELTGGGTGKDIGLTPVTKVGTIIHAGKINLHLLQNGVIDTLRGVYPGTPDGTITEKPAATLPIIDAHGPGDTAPGTFPPNTTTIPASLNGDSATTFAARGSPFVWTPGTFKITQLSARKFRIQTGDSPAGGSPRTHPSGTKARLATIAGENGFKSAIASASRDALTSIVVHAEIAWSAIYDGKVQYPATAPGAPPNNLGTYVRTTARTTVPARFTLISAATGGKDAGAAPNGYEIHEPRFNHGLGTTVA